VLHVRCFVYARCRGRWCLPDVQQPSSGPASTPAGAACRPEPPSGLAEARARHLRGDGRRCSAAPQTRQGTRFAAHRDRSDGRIAGRRYLHGDHHPAAPADRRVDFPTAPFAVAGLDPAPAPRRARLARRPAPPAVRRAASGAERAGRALDTRCKRVARDPPALAARQGEAERRRLTSPREARHSCRLGLVSSSGL